jgi:hypothetical protein
MGHGKGKRNAGRAAWLEYLTWLRHGFLMYTLQDHLPTGKSASTGVAGIAGVTRATGAAGVAGVAGVARVAGAAGVAGRRAGVAWRLDLDTTAQPVGVRYVFLIHTRRQAELFADVHVAVLFRSEAVIPVLPLGRHAHLSVLHSNFDLIRFKAAHVH